MTVEYADFRRIFRDREHAARYDRTRFGGLFRSLNQRLWRRALRRLFREAAIGSHGFVLDLPAGTGRLVPLFVELGIEAVGADLSLEMLGEARRKGGERLLVGDAERLPFRDGAVDGIVSLRFFSHPPLEARERILAEMARVARRFVIVDCRFRNRFREAIRAATAFARKKGEGRKERPSLGSIGAEFEAAGFRVARVVRPSLFFSDNGLVFGVKAARPTPEGRGGIASFPAVEAAETIGRNARGPRGADAGKADPSSRKSRTRGGGGSGDPW